MMMDILELLYWELQLEQNYYLHTKNIHQQLLFLQCPVATSSDRGMVEFDLSDMMVGMIENENDVRNKGNLEK